MAKLPVEKVKDLVSHVKANSERLASEGIDKDELDRHIARIEAEIKKPEPDHSALGEMLASFETTFELAEEKLAMNGVFRLLNTIFGTGVPEPPNRR